MNKKLRMLLDIIGLGFAPIVCVTFFVTVIAFNFGWEVKGLDSPFLLIMVFVLTIWSFYSLFSLEKYINPKVR